MSPGALVTSQDLGRTFGRGDVAVVAVHGATCAIRPGDRIGLVGPSGSGKSTLLHCLAGLDHPTSGTITWPLLDGVARLRRAAIRMVFQDPSLIPTLDALENVALALVLTGTPNDEARRRAHLALERLDLGDLAAKLPEELSGGQAQRVGVARALVSEPRLLLADEPTGKLDHDAAMLVIDSLIETADHTGCGLLVSTHDPAVSDRMDRSWSMIDGRLRIEELTCSH